MANNIIDSKTAQTSFFGENVTTQLTLEQTAANQFGIAYQITYTGTQSGSSSGGPVAVSQNGAFQANPNPPVTVTISGYTDTGTNISMQVLIQVKVPILGKKTIFNDTLSGPYNATSNLTNMTDHIAALSK